MDNTIGRILLKGQGPGLASVKTIEAHRAKLEANPTEAIGPGAPASQSIAQKVAEADIVKELFGSLGHGNKLDVLASYFIAAGIFYQSIAAQFGEHSTQAQNYIAQTQDALYQMLKFYS